MREKNVREINLTKENICFANKISVEDNVIAAECTLAYSARTAHPFQRNGAPFRFKLSKAQQVD